VPRHPQKFKKSMLGTNFYHSFRLNFHIYKSQAPPLICSSFAPARARSIAAFSTGPIASRASPPER
jgi:hypothetical protein